MGAAGEVITFVILLALQGILAFYVLSYTSRVFMTVLQDTAAGNDEVIWRDEPFADGLWTLFYLGWIVFCSSAPSILLLPLGPLLPDQAQGVWQTACPIVSLWLFAPILMLSSLSYGYWWALISPVLLHRMSKRLVQVAVFYVLSAFLGATWLLLLFLTVSRAMQVLLPAAIFQAAAVLIYARLLGRLGLLLSRVRIKERKKKKTVRREKPSVVKTNDPWAVPEPGTFTRGPTIVHPFDGPVESYLLEEEVLPAHRQTSEEAAADAPRVPFDGPAEPYEVTEQESVELPVIEESVEEAKLIERRTPALPRRPLTVGVWTFPFRPSNLKALFWLSLGYTVIGGIALIQLRIAGALWGS